jgi:hypothetical protein
LEQSKAAKRSSPLWDADSDDNCQNAGIFRLRFYESPHSPYKKSKSGIPHMPMKVAVSAIFMRWGEGHAFMDDSTEFLYKADPAKSEAEWVTNGTHKSVARDAP